jgi:flavodoxin
MAGRIEVFHASKYGNGAKVAEEFRRSMGEHGVEVNVHHIKDSRPSQVPGAEIYLFISPARIGRPIGSMRRFVKKLDLPPGTKYGLIATHGAPQPDKKTGVTPTIEENERYYTTNKVLGEILDSKGMVRVAEERIFVVQIKGPLEDGWQEKVNSFVGEVMRAIC